MAMAKHLSLPEPRRRLISRGDETRRWITAVPLVWVFIPWAYSSVTNVIAGPWATSAPVVRTAGQWVCAIYTHCSKKKRCAIYTHYIISRMLLIIYRSSILQVLFFRVSEWLFLSHNLNKKGLLSLNYRTGNTEHIPYIV